MIEATIKGPNFEEPHSFTYTVKQKEELHEIKEYLRLGLEEKYPEAEVEVKVVMK